jgi:threonine/homoserine/homoserine lactone efflux protein
VLAFLGISLVVIMTPGQDTALTIRNTLVGGRRNGLRTALGVSCGQLVWALAASTGLAALLAASEPAFDAITLIGAAYLILLGALTLVWLTLYAFAVARALDAVTGTALDALGLGSPLRTGSERAC